MTPDLLFSFDAEKYSHKRITVVVPDNTRNLNYATTLKPLARLLHAAQAEVTFVVALGLHRPMTDAEMVPLLSIAESIGAPVHQHDPRSGALEQHTSGAWFHRRRILGADHIINVGVVEPHQYAGFSGGVKGVAIGCAGAQTIAELHEATLLRNVNVTVGVVEENPFQENLWNAVEGLPISGLFEIPGTEKVVFGDARPAFERAIDIATANHFVSYDAPFDWMHIPIPHGKAQNFYQASRAATYIALMKNSALREHGTIVLNAPCPEGVGKSDGERACADAMMLGSTELLQQLNDAEKLGNSGGAQRAFVLALALQRAEIAVVGASKMPELKAMGISQYRTLEDAKNGLGLNGNGVCIDDPFHRLPVLAQP